MVEGAFHHGFGHRRAVFGQDVLFQAAAVDADADGHVFGVAGVGHRLDPVIGADVARVDADLVRPGVQRRQRSAVIKVDIGHHRDVHRFFDGGHHRGVLRGGDRHADDLAARLGHPFRLGHVARNILDRHVEHGLHGDGMVAADGHVADLYFPFQLALHRAPP